MKSEKLEAGLKQEFPFLKYPPPNFVCLFPHFFARAFAELLYSLPVAWDPIQQGKVSYFELFFEKSYESHVKILLAHCENDIILIL